MSNYVGVEIDTISGEVRIRLSADFAEELLRDLDDLDAERVATLRAPLPNVAREVHRAMLDALQPKPHYGQPSQGALEDDRDLVERSERAGGIDP